MRFLLILCWIGLFSAGSASDIAVRLAEVGNPQYETMRTYEGYIVSYDPRTKLPWWVYEYLDAETLTQEVPRQDHFVPDYSFPRIHCAANRDYAGSGYDRGHMAPAVNHRRNTQEMVETFFLSNTCPQEPMLNRQFWRKVESWVRRIALEEGGMHVFTGPLFLASKSSNGRRYVSYPVIGQGDIAVPTHFFKVGLATDSGQVFALIVPNVALNARHQIIDFMVPISEVEFVAGLLFSHE